jgi:hypothetical protein
VICPRRFQACARTDRSELTASATDLTSRPRRSAASGSNDSSARSTRHASTADDKRSGCAWTVQISPPLARAISTRVPKALSMVASRRSPKVVSPPREATCAIKPLISASRLRPSSMCRRMATCLTWALRSDMARSNCEVLASRRRRLSFGFFQCKSELPHGQNECLRGTRPLMPRPASRRRVFTDPPCVRDRFRFVAFRGVSTISTWRRCRS